MIPHKMHLAPTDGSKILGRCKVGEETRYCEIFYDETVGGKEYPWVSMLPCSLSSVEFYKTEFFDRFFYLPD